MKTGSQELARMKAEFRAQQTTKTVTGRVGRLPQSFTITPEELSKVVNNLGNLKVVAPKNRNTYSNGTGSDQSTRWNENRRALLMCTSGSSTASSGVSVS
jgi:hypothetical protein